MLSPSPHKTWTLNLKNFMPQHAFDLDSHKAKTDLSIFGVLKTQKLLLVKCEFKTDPQMRKNS